MISKFILPSVAVLFSAIFSSCVLKNTPDRNSRYMVDITNLEKVDFYRESWVYRHPTIKITEYRKFIVAPVSMYENTAKKTPKHFRPAFERAADRFRQKAMILLEKDYDVVTTPGQNVLRIEYNVVDIKPIVKLNNNVTETIVADPSLVGSKLEVDCFDSITNERIYALSTLYKGAEYAAYKDLEAMGAVETAFDEWIHFFKKRFDNAVKGTALQ